MTEETNIKEAVEEIREANEENLQKVIEDWFERTRTQGMKLGATYISAGIYGAIQKHIVKKKGASLRDYKRCMDDIIKIISVQLATQQNDSEENDNNLKSEDVENNG